MLHSSRVYVDIPVCNQLASSGILKRKLEKTVTDENIHRGPSTTSVANPPVPVVMLPAKRARAGALEHPLAINKASVGNQAENSVTVPCYNASLVSVHPTWRPVHKSCDRETIEARITMYEFSHRFQKQLKLSNAHLYSLCRFDDLPMNACKALLGGLLQLIHQDEPYAESKQQLAEALKKLRSTTINIEDMWKTIQEIRSCFVVRLAEPTLKELLPDELAMRRITRGGSQDVVHSVQLIPVINSLIYECVQTSIIRQEIDQGIKESARLARERIALIKDENAKWDTLRTSMLAHKEQGKLVPGFNFYEWNQKIRDEREAHKATVAAISLRTTAALQRCQLRTSPLGRDSDGRVYYALSHPHATSATPKSKQKTSLGKVPSNAERARLEDWHYFVFVWGRKPEGAPLFVKALDDGNETEDKAEDDGEAKWWAFPESGTVRALSKWVLADAKDKDARAASTASTEIAVVPSKISLGVTNPAATPFPTTTSRTMAYPTPITNATRSLTKGLDEFADFLEFRCGSTTDKT